MLSDNAFMLWIGVLTAIQVAFCAVGSIDPKLDPFIAGLPITMAVATLLIELACDRWRRR